jgi:hypothetical protein
VEIWNIVCDSSSSWHRSTPARQNENIFKLEHNETDRWQIKGLDNKLLAKGYSTYRIYCINRPPCNNRPPRTLRAHISTKEQNFQMIFIAFS